MNLTHHITNRLASFGVPNPPKSLIESLEKRLEEKIEKMVARNVNRRVIIQSFADSLTSPAPQDNSVEGGAEGDTPTAQQMDGAEGKPSIVAGTVSDTADNPETA